MGAEGCLSNGLFFDVRLRSATASDDRLHSSSQKTDTGFPITLGVNPLSIIDPNLNSNAPGIHLTASYYPNDEPVSSPNPIFSDTFLNLPNFRILYIVCPAANIISLHSS